MLGGLKATSARDTGLVPGRGSYRPRARCPPGADYDARRTNAIRAVASLIVPTTRTS
jgi:hypothetical protein